MTTKYKNVGDLRVSLIAHDDTVYHVWKLSGDTNIQRYEMAFSLTGMRVFLKAGTPRELSLLRDRVEFIVMVAGPRSLFTDSRFNVVKPHDNNHVACVFTDTERLPVE